MISLREICGLTIDGAVSVTVQCRGTLLDVDSRLVTGRAAR
jgi:hypothetical protein